MKRFRPTKYSTLTENQREESYSRIVHDANLLISGADIDKRGRLDPTEKQKRSLYINHVLKPQLNEFLEGTADGRRVNHYKKQVRGVGVVVGGLLMHNLPYGRDEQELYLEAANDTSSDPSISSVFDLKRLRAGDVEYARQIGGPAPTKFPTTLEQLADDALDARVLEGPFGALEILNQNLKVLSYGLIEFPQYGIGSELSDGRRVEAMTPSAMLSVGSAAQGYQELSVEQLHAQEHPPKR